MYDRDEDVEQGDLAQQFQSEDEPVLILHSSASHPNATEGEEDAAPAPLRRVPAHCVVCLGVYEPGDTVIWSLNHSCHHVFHDDCILTWLSRGKRRCPCCRKKFVQPTEQQSKDASVAKEASLDEQGEAVATAADDAPPVNAPLPPDSPPRFQPGSLPESPPPTTTEMLSAASPTASPVTTMSPAARRALDSFFVDEDEADDDPPSDAEDNEDEDDDEGDEENRCEHHRGGGAGGAPGASSSSERRRAAARTASLATTTTSLSLLSLTSSSSASMSESVSEDAGEGMNAESSSSDADADEHEDEEEDQQPRLGSDDRV